MKKRIRFLSLVLSMVLLLISAAPAFASTVVPDPYEYFTKDYPPAATYSKEETIGNYSYRMETSRLPDDDKYHCYVDEAYHNPNLENTFLEGTISAGVKTWTGSGNFDAAHLTNLTNIGVKVGVAYGVSNHEHSYAYEMTGDYPKGYYTVVLTCYHYFVQDWVYSGGEQQSYQYINEMPFIYDEYYYLEY